FVTNSNIGDGAVTKRILRVNQPEFVTGLVTERAYAVVACSLRVRERPIFEKCRVLSGCAAFVFHGVVSVRVRDKVGVSRRHRAGSMLYSGCLLEGGIYTHAYRAFVLFLFEFK